MTEALVKIAKNLKGIGMALSDIEDKLGIRKKSEDKLNEKS